MLGIKVDENDYGSDPATEYMLRTEMMHWTDDEL